jgi:hypothetical protein
VFGKDVVSRRRYNVLCLEILALQLKADTLYNGIRLPDGVTEVRIISHADDTTLFAEDASAIKRFFLKFIKTTRRYRERQ